MWDKDLAQVNIEKHCIELTSENLEPIQSTPYLAGPKARQFEKAEFENILSQKVIEPTQTEWAAPIVTASKTDGFLRFWVDHKKSDAVSKRYSYTILWMNDCIDSLGVVSLFST